MRKALGYTICGVSCFAIGYLYTMLMVGGEFAMDEMYGTHYCKDELRRYGKIFLKLTGVKNI